MLLLRQSQGLHGLNVHGRSIRDIALLTRVNHRTLSRRVKLITVLDSERPAYSPQTRTIEEQGGKIPFLNYRVFVAPKGVPADIKAALAAALNKAILTPEVKVHHDTIFNPVRDIGPEGSTKDVISQAEKWKAYYADKK